MNSKNKELLIVYLLDQVSGSRAALAKELGITSSGVNRFLRSSGAHGIGLMKKYTDAFNSIFETEYSFKELFNFNFKKYEQK